MLIVFFWPDYLQELWPDSLFRPKLIAGGVQQREDDWGKQFAEEAYAVLDGVSWLYHEGNGRDTTLASKLSHPDVGMLFRGAADNAYDIKKKAWSSTEIWLTGLGPATEGYMLSFPHYPSNVYHDK